MLKIFKIIFKLLLLLSIVLFILAFFNYQDLPSSDKILPETEEQPHQREIETGKIYLEKNGFQAEMDLLYEYDLHGLVVEDYNSDSAFDFTHSRFDPFNTKDICVIWGENTQNNIYKQVEFSHGEFTCYFRAPTQDLYAKFNPYKLSNNHLIPASDEVARLISQTKPGDQIHLSGFLVNNKITLPTGGQSTRNTSTTRKDTGNGACEVIYVDDFQILAAGNRFWTGMLNFSRKLIFVSLVCLFTLFFWEMIIFWKRSG